jgi:hypothetical protein
LLREFETGCATSSACLKAALAGAFCICFTGLALAKDGDDDDGSSNGASKTPNIYLDMRTAYASVPAGSLPIGFGSPALVTALQSLALSRANSHFGHAPLSFGRAGHLLAVPSAYRSAAAHVLKDAKQLPMPAT